MDSSLMKKYTQILKNQLVPAQGCTEPIAIAYAGAILKELLGETPDKINAKVSRNIIKNAKSVIVPNTGGLKGIEAAVSAGVVAGNAELELEVISGVISKQHKAISDFLNRQIIKVETAADDKLFDILLEGESENHTAKVEISDTHTNVVYKEKDEKILLNHRGESSKAALRLREEESESLEDNLTAEKIIEYIEEVPLEEIEFLIRRQIDYNMAIAIEAIHGDYGANIGKVLLNSGDTSVKTRAKAMAAAGSDGRMSGCELPVIIVCGSGNQGITTSLPIVEYANYYHIEDERLIRAVALSDLMAIHVKHGIGTLSAYCGAVCAGCAAGAGIAYLMGGDERKICHTLVNALAIVSGIVCDGAKPSCAAKIASSIDAGILGYEMAKANQQFYSGDGIVTKGIEGNIKNIARIGCYGMRETDNEIMDIMLS